MSRIDTAFERAAERDADRCGRRQIGVGDDRLHLSFRVVERHTPVAPVERLGRGERAVDTFERRRAQAVVALEIEYEARILRPASLRDPGDGLFGARHLRHAVIADERHRLDSRKSRRSEAVDQVCTYVGREDVRLVLEAVARPDVAERYVHIASFADSPARA